MSRDEFAVDDRPQEAAGDALQHLTFILGKETYAVDILCVEEIKSGETITPIPRTPDYIKGVMNLRGAIVPVVDLRERFNIKPSSQRPVDVVIILNIETEDGRRTVGAIVDDVDDVVGFSEDSIKPSPDLGSKISTQFIHGIVTVDDQVIIALNQNRLFSLEELSRLDDVEAMAEEDGDAED